jgi:flagellar basal-body rod protein FlgB
MFEGTTFHKTMHISGRLLDAYTLREEVIADNIANASTPNFKRSEVTFEAEIQRALTSERQPAIPTKMTHQKHIPFRITKDYKKVDPQIAVEYDTNYMNNKNNVDVDREMADHAKNAMRYQMFTQLMGQQYRQLRRVIGVV